MKRYRNDGRGRKPSILPLPTSFPKQIPTPSRFKFILLINNGHDWKDHDSSSFWAENFGRSLEGQGGPTRGFFFLWYGRSRSEARSLHETKLLVRKLLHGRRWSHESWQIITDKTIKTQTNKTRARRRSPSQICVLPSERQQSKQRTGQEPNRKNHKRFAKDTVVKTHCVALKTKTCSKRIKSHPEVRHAIYMVARKTTRVAFTIHCRLTPPLRVLSRVLVHVPKFREWASIRWRKHEQEDDDICGQVSCAPPRCGERPSGDDSAVSQDRVSDHL